MTDGRTKWAMPVATLVLGLAVGSVPWMAQAQAQAPGAAQCVTVAGTSLAGKGEKGLAQERPLIAANFQAVAPLAEQWANQQIAEGRSRFFTATIAPNASIVCAW